MKLRRLLPVALAMLAAIAQYEVLQLFAAGQRQGVFVAVSSYIFAIMAVYGMPYIATSKVWQFLICVLVPMMAACAVLLLAEKMERPEITVLLRPEGLKLAALTTVFAGGWLVGLAAFCGILLAETTKKETLPIP